MTDSPDLAAWAKALAHPARLSILATLGARGTCTCGEVVPVVGLAQSTVSQHLKVLRQAGLITGTTDGPRSCYCLDRAAIRSASAELSGFLDGLGACDDCC